MKKFLFDLLMPIVPKNDLSHAVGKIVHLKLPGPIGRKSVKWFAQYYKINLNEAELAIECYPTIGALFTRKLKKGARPVGSGVVHPADAVITEAGPIRDMTLIQAKGRTYSASGLLGGGPYAQNFENGAFATYYLCPTDYHRVHSPVDGKIIWVNHVPGTLWPVNDWSTHAVPNLFNVNERIAVVIETERGLVALVMVAATNVGNMSMTFDSTLSTKIRQGDRRPRPKVYENGLSLHRGDEVGVFHMGSTVIMLYAPGVLPINPAELKGVHSKMGAAVTDTTGKKN